MQVKQPHIAKVIGDCPSDDGARQWRNTFGPEIIGESSALIDALHIAMQASEFDCPVLICGETGTGKELLANAIHRASPRGEKPFVAVNCPAIPKDLFESELFGHAKGAFTGATAARLGRFTAAHHGTLFLDEIGELEFGVQSKLLRVLQDYEITPVGESRSQHVDVRVIAATNKNLQQLAAEGSFRDDVLYRLNVLQIDLPPLRERAEDIGLLIDSLLASLAQARHVPRPTLSHAAHAALTAYQWPGNVRQLRNLLERLVILRRGHPVDVEHLPQTITGASTANTSVRAVARVAPDEHPKVELPQEGFDLRAATQRFEQAYIKQALIATNGNRNQAAKILGLNRTTLVEKIRKLG